MSIMTISKNRTVYASLQMESCNSQKITSRWSKNKKIDQSLKEIDADEDTNHFIERFRYVRI